MIRGWLIVLGLVAGLAGCSPSSYPGPELESSAEPAIAISGTAVSGVAGGSGQPTRMVSGVKDVEMSVGLSLGGG